MADEDDSNPLHGDLTDEEDDEAKIVCAPMKDFIDKLRTGGIAQIESWHKEILSRPPKFERFLQNMDKNRYPNIVLYDQNRVKLRDQYGLNAKDDYIHASWLDSYEQPRGYICCQAPFNEATERDFWRMCIMVKPVAILLLTPSTKKVKEKTKLAVHEFWPGERQSKPLEKTSVEIKCTSFDEDRDHDRYEIAIEEKGKELSSYPFVQYKAWEEDKQIPVNLLDFRASIRILLTQRIKELANQKIGPFVLVCPTGAHRCGTYVGLDVVLDRVAAERKVGLSETVALIREQRFGTFVNFDHYTGVADIVVRHAVSSNIVNPDAIGKRNK